MGKHSGSDGDGKATTHKGSHGSGKLGKGNDNKHRVAAALVLGGLLALGAPIVPPFGSVNPGGVNQPAS